MVGTEHTGESRDGTGSGDHDVTHPWGHSRGYLTMWQLAHLLVMRGYIKDHQGAIEGDSDWVVPSPSGLLVPATFISEYGRE